VTFARTALSLVLAVQLAACGGGGSSSSPPATGGGGTPAPSPTPAACSLRARQDFADQVLNEWYLFPDLLATVNQNSVTNLDDYLDARVAPARAANRDRGFTFATSIAEENAVINSGSSAGFGIRLSYDTANRRLFVVEAYEGAPGLAAGLDRGTEITAIGTTSANLQSVSSLFAIPGDNGGAQAVANALGPSEPGVSRVLRFTQPGGAVIERSITKTEFALDPVSDRYGALILNDGGKRVGYLNLRTFIVSDAANQLRTAFGQFAAQGVTELILDLRYNGGGLVSVGDTFGDLMGAGRVGQVWSKEILRASKSAENSTRLFRTEANAIAPTKVAVITTGSSASASELVANSLIPYLGSNLALVGANSFGKPVGQFGFDLAACDLRVRAVAFRTVNANDQGDYYTGLASVMPNTCRAGDDIAFPLGDPREASIATALNFLGGRTCSPITSSRTASATGGATQGERLGGGVDLPERVPLQPRRPGPAQHELPGLY
jgi:carboxyl-terminal processing protease